jgi:hypothetical protein
MPSLEIPHADPGPTVGELPENAQINETDAAGDMEDQGGFEFGEVDESEQESDEDKTKKDIDIDDI